MKNALCSNVQTAKRLRNDENKYITLDHGAYDYHFDEGQGDVHRLSRPPIEVGRPGVHGAV
jgi:hypothetical protein